MSDVDLKLSEDEALVLCEFFTRYEETENLAFEHPAERVAFMKIAAQVDMAIPQKFDSNYEELLQDARERLVTGAIDTDLGEDE